MVIVINGLPFETESPSYYRLARTWTGSDTIDISYIDNGEWMLFHERESGAVNYSVYHSRDEAMAPVIQAFRNEGFVVG